MSLKLNVIETTRYQPSHTAGAYTQADVASGETPELSPA